MSFATTPAICSATSRLRNGLSRHFLIRAAWGRLKGLLAIRAAARLEDHFL
jgi:hypothetical protein